MQKDVKVGVAIGVLIIALVVIFWWAHEQKNTPNMPPAQDTATVTPPLAPTQPPSAPTEETTPAIDWTRIDESAPARAPDTPLAPAPTQPPAPPAPAAPAQTARTHIVQKNETLSSIAKKYYGDQRKWTTIHQANKTAIPNPNAMKIGLKIVIPRLAPPPAATRTGNSGITLSTTTPAAKRHVVREGDTLSTIARQYYGSETHWRRIQQANPQRTADPTRLKVGVVLTIPMER